MHGSAMTFLALLLAAVGAFPYHNADLYEGSFCQMENNLGEGKCVKLPECPMRIDEVKRGIRFANSPGRCSFDNFIEIVCCPLAQVGGGNQIPATRLPTITTTQRTMVRNTQPPVVARPTTASTPTWTAPATRPTTGETFELNLGDDFENKLGIRPADVACREIEKNVTGTKATEVNTWIFGGDNATKGEFPHMVAVGYHTDKENPNAIRYNCGGTLITVQHVLTAAHCVSNIYNYVPAEVKLGAIELSDNSDLVQNIKVSEVIPHPQYKRSVNYFDIAILKLARPAVITTYVKPACLRTIPLADLPNLVNTSSLVVTGWGATSFEDESSNTLQKTPRMTLIERTECSKFYKNSSKLPRGIDDSMICLLDKNVTRRADACQGDSGGPLLYGAGPTSMVVGVTSFGQSCGSIVPGIYTSVRFHLDWIEEVVWPDKKRALRR